MTDTTYLALLNLLLQSEWESPFDEEDYADLSKAMAPKAEKEASK